MNSTDSRVPEHANRQPRPARANKRSHRPARTLVAGRQPARPFRTDDLTIDGLRAELEFLDDAFMFIARYAQHHGELDRLTIDRLQVQLVRTKTLLKAYRTPSAIREDGDGA